MYLFSLPNGVVNISNTGTLSVLPLYILYYRCWQAKNYISQTPLQLGCRCNLGSTSQKRLHETDSELCCRVIGKEWRGSRHCFAGAECGRSGMALGNCSGSSTLMIIFLCKYITIIICLLLYIIYKLQWHHTLLYLYINILYLLLYIIYYYYILYSFP